MNKIHSFHSLGDGYLQTPQLLQLTYSWICNTIIKKFGLLSVKLMNNLETSLNFDPLLLGLLFLFGNQTPCHYSLVFIKHIATK